MNNNQIIKGITRAFNKVKFQVVKYSPEILMVTGIVGTVASTVLACRATLKSKKDIDDCKLEIYDIESTTKVRVENKDGVSELVDYDENAKKYDIQRVKVKTVLSVTKHYSPVVIIGVSSVVCILASNNIMKKRAAALAAAYAAIDATFKDYRERVVDRYGKDIDNELRYGIHKETTKDTVVDEETGKKKTVTNEKNVVDDNVSGYCDLTRCFDQTNPYWTSGGFYNQMFLTGQENYVNDLLRLNGHVFLNEVLERIGFPQTKYGQVIGWTYDKENPKKSYIDFNIVEAETSTKNEKYYMLEFNCDGYILDKIS